MYRIFFCISNLKDPRPYSHSHTGPSIMHGLCDVSVSDKIRLLLLFPMVVSSMTTRDTALCRTMQRFDLHTLFLFLFRTSGLNNEWLIHQVKNEEFLQYHLLLLQKSKQDGSWLHGNFQGAVGDNVCHIQ